MLSATGFMDPANQANFDGQFGSGNEGALKKFQSSRGLTADGVCGQNHLDESAQWHDTTRSSDVHLSLHRPTGNATNGCDIGARP